MITAEDESGKENAKESSRNKTGEPMIESSKLVMDLGKARP